MALLQLCRKTLRFLPVIFLFDPISWCTVDTSIPDWDVETTVINNTVDTIRCLQHPCSHLDSLQLSNALEWRLDEAIRINPYESGNVKIGIYSDGKGGPYYVYTIIISSKTMEKYSKEEIIDSQRIDACYMIPLKKAVASPQTIVYDGTPHPGYRVTRD